MNPEFKTFENLVNLADLKKFVNETITLWQKKYPNQAYPPAIFLYVIDHGIPKVGIFSGLLFEHMGNRWEAALQHYVRSIIQYSPAQNITPMYSIVAIEAWVRVDTVGDNETAQDVINRNRGKRVDEAPDRKEVILTFVEGEDFQEVVSYDMIRENNTVRLVEEHNSNTNKSDPELRGAWANLMYKPKPI